MNLITWIAYDTYWNWFHPYSFFIFCGFIITIILSWNNFYKYNIPIKGFYLGIFIITPISLLGASFFGKFNIKNQILFFELFYFWKPGLSIHGGLIFGIISGLIWFSFESRQYNISLLVYADLIIPNILLAQAIGRWGNFFNHELLGSPINRENLMWLPSFIRDNLFKWYIPILSSDNFYPNEAIDIYGGHVNPINLNSVQYFQPIFLYESFFNILLWILIVIILPLIFYYSYYWRFKKEEPDFIKLSLKGIYLKWFYNIKPSYKKIININLLNKTNFKKNYFKNKYNITKKNFIKIYCKYYFELLKKFLMSDIRELEKLENPHNLKILRCGTKTGFYISFYNFIRIILEIQRHDHDLFLKNMRTLNYIIIIIMILIGIILIIFSQLIIIIKWRKINWLYEKQY